MLTILFNGRFFFRSALLLTFPFLLQAQSFPGNKTIAKQFSLGYSYPEDEYIKYLNYSNITQTINNRGRDVVAEVLTINYARVRGAGTDGNDVKVDFKIDSIVQSISTVKKYTPYDSDSLPGLKFTISVSQSGREKDINGLQDLCFTGSDGSQLFAGQFFADFFPDLPEEIVCEGFTWHTDDTVKMGFGESNQVNILSCENKVAGELWFKGKECVRIESVIKGTADIHSVSQGMNVHVTGSIEGKRVYYFHKTEGNFIYLGHFIYDKEESTITGKLELDAARRGTFPFSMKIEKLREVVE